MIWAIASVGLVAVLLLIYAALWVGGDCDAHLDMAEHERRCRR